MTTTPPWPTPQPARAYNWPSLVLGILTSGLATAALVVALTRPGAGSTPTYTAAQKDRSKTQLCERYKLASGAVYVETGPQGDGDIALARISMTNGALILETAAVDPALDHKYRVAAEDLARAYQTTAALATKGMATSQQYEDAVEDSNSKRDVMEKLCAN